MFDVIFIFICFCPRKFFLIYITFNFIHAMTKRCVNFLSATMINSSSAVLLPAAGCAIDNIDLLRKGSDRERVKVHLLVSSHFSITSGRKYLKKKLPQLYFLSNSNDESSAQHITSPSDVLSALNLPNVCGKGLLYFDRQPFSVVYMQLWNCSGTSVVLVHL